MRIWTLLDISASNDDLVKVFTDEDALWEWVKNDASDAQRDSGQLMPEERERWAEFILGYGWKVSYYEIGEHEIKVPARASLGRLGSSADLDAADAADSHEVAL